MAEAYYLLMKEPGGIHREGSALNPKSSIPSRLLSRLWVTDSMGAHGT